MAHSSYGDFSPLSNSQRPNASNISDDFESTATAYAQDYGSIELESDGVATAEAPFGRIYTPVRGFQAAVDVEEDVREDFWRVNSPAYRWGKRVFDILFSAAAIAATSPLLLLIAIAIKLSSPGPVFFEQERVGKNGKIFNMLKFRTMRMADKELTDRLWRAVDDPRRTGVGALLRRTSLDELPQFFNVLIGQMSVVGPRPERPYFVEKFSIEIPGYERRHAGEVGITGLAQIHGYRGDTCIETRVSYDVEYLQSWSFGLDCNIVWKTVVRGIFFSSHE